MRLGSESRQSFDGIVLRLGDNSQNLAPLEVKSVANPDKTQRDATRLSNFCQDPGLIGGGKD